jgi:hypothetical protein
MLPKDFGYIQWLDSLGFPYTGRDGAGSAERQEDEGPCRTPMGDDRD